MISLAKSLNCDGRNGRALLLVSLGMLAVGWPAAFMRTHFAYERSALLRGEHWRWITAHAVHLDLAHAAVNVIGLALVWALYLRVWTRIEWLLPLVAGMLAIDAGLWWWQPQVQWYVGASGLLHGLLVAGLIGQWRTERGVALVVGTLLLAKLGWEWRHGALPFAGEGGRVVLASHRYGAAGGAIAGLLLTLRRKWL